MSLNQSLRHYSLHYRLYLVVLGTYLQLYSMLLQYSVYFSLLLNIVNSKDFSFTLPYHCHTLHTIIIIK